MRAVLIIIMAAVLSNCVSRPQPYAENTFIGVKEFYRHHD